MLRVGARTICRVFFLSKRCDSQCPECWSSNRVVNNAMPAIDEGAELVGVSNSQTPVT